MDLSPAAAPVPQKVTPITHTTRRAIATSSLTLGVWGCLVFWWYPFGILIASAATAMALISIALGWRAGKEGQHLAWLGLFFGGSGVGMAVAAYRFMQFVFDGIVPQLPFLL